MINTRGQSEKGMSTLKSTWNPNGPCFCVFYTHSRFSCPLFIRAHYIYNVWLIKKFLQLHGLCSYGLLENKQISTDKMLLAFKSVFHDWRKQKRGNGVHFGQNFTMNNAVLVLAPPLGRSNWQWAGIHKCLCLICIFNSRSEVVKNLPDFSFIYHEMSIYNVYILYIIK